jgi:hypothetical protein
LERSKIESRSAVEEESTVGCLRAHVLASLQVPVPFDAAAEGKELQPQ